MSPIQQGLLEHFFVQVLLGEVSRGLEDLPQCLHCLLLRLNDTLL